MSQLAVQDTWMDASLVVHQVQQIQQIYKNVMKSGIHYGPTFPGSQKPSLLLPGIELLNLIFRIDIQVEKEITDLGGGHREYTIAATAYNIVTGQRLGSGVGSCSTMESKYRYRQAKLKCPECDQETIIRGKEQFGGGWVCWKKGGGCGKKFAINDKKITEQERGRIENPDIADQYNTVLKMAKKRAMADATKTVTGASAFFTQDAEDFVDAKFENVPDYQQTQTPTPEKDESETEPLPSQKTLIAKAEAIVQRIGHSELFHDGKKTTIKKRWEVAKDQGFENEDLHQMVEWLSKKEKEFLENAGMQKIEPIMEEKYKKMLDFLNHIYGEKSAEVHSFEKCYRQEQWAECWELYDETEITQQAQQEKK